MVSWVVLVIDVWPDCSVWIIYKIPGDHKQSHNLHGCGKRRFDNWTTLSHLHVWSDVKSSIEMYKEEWEHMQVCALAWSSGCRVVRRSCSYFLHHSFTLSDLPISLSACKLSNISFTSGLQNTNPPASHGSFKDDLSTIKSHVPRSCIYLLPPPLHDFHLLVFDSDSPQLVSCDPLTTLCTLFGLPLSPLPFCLFYPHPTPTHTAFWPSQGLSPHHWSPFIPPILICSS